MGNLEKLKELLKHKKSKKFYAGRLGVSEKEVETLLQQVRGLEIEDKPLNSTSTNLDKGTMEMTFYYDHPPHPDEVISSHKIDLSKWKLSQYYSKQRSRGYQVTAVFTSITKEQLREINFMDFFKTYEAPKLNFTVKKNDKFTAPCMAELNLCDSHIDKWGLEGESIDELCNTYFGFVENLIRKAYASHNLEEIVFVVGNDFFTSDNILNSTALHMNPQEINARWDEAYEKGFDLMVRSIMMLKGFADKLNIIVMPGNHDKSKSYYLGHALEAFFKNEETIIFSRTSAPRKLHVYGSTAICYHHGNCKQEKLPLIMASEFPKEWGATKYHRVHTGDKHFQYVREIDGVIIQQFPSLSQTDTWHNENNFHLSQRVGLLNVYDREKGIIAEYQEKI